MKIEPKHITTLIRQMAGNITTDGFKTTLIDYDGDDDVEVAVEHDTDSMQPWFENDGEVVPRAGVSRRVRALSDIDWTATAAKAVAENWHSGAPIEEIILMEKERVRAWINYDAFYTCVTVSVKDSRASLGGIDYYSVDAAHIKSADCIKYLASTVLDLIKECAPQIEIDPACHELVK